MPRAKQASEPVYVNSGGPNIGPEYEDIYPQGQNQTYGNKNNSPNNMEGALDSETFAESTYQNRAYENVANTAVEYQELGHRPDVTPTTYDVIV
jgi:hypothetical protein